MNDSGRNLRYINHSDICRMAFLHQYSVEECGRKKKLRGPGGEGAICEFCETAFSSTKDCNRHVELDKQCRKARRELRRRVRQRVQQMASADDDSGISVEEEDEKSRLQPLRIKINLAKKKVQVTSHKTENAKEGRSPGRSSVHLESRDIERFGEERPPTIERLQTWSQPTQVGSESKPMVQIKEEILRDLSSIKSEPVEDGSHAASGIRVALEKTKGRRYSVAFTSSLPPSQEGCDQSTTVGEKVSKKEADSHKTRLDTDEPASKQTKNELEKKGNSEEMKNSCVQKKRSRGSLGGDSEKWEVFHLAEGTFKPVLPDHLRGVWVAFDSSFLASLNTVFCFRLTKDGQVSKSCLPLNDNIP